MPITLKRTNCCAVLCASLQYGSTTLLFEAELYGTRYSERISWMVIAVCVCVWAIVAGIKSYSLLPAESVHHTTHYRNSHEFSRSKMYFFFLFFIRENPSDLSGSKNASGCDESLSWWNPVGVNKIKYNFPFYSEWCASVLSECTLCIRTATTEKTEINQLKKYSIWLLFVSLTRSLCDAIADGMRFVGGCSSCTC